MPGLIEAKIRDLALMGWSAPQIHRQLALDFPNTNLPVLRTVRRVVDRYVPRDTPRGGWSIADADPDDAALLLPVLAAAVGDRRMFVPMPAEIARWIVRICRAAPGIPPAWALDVALGYAWRTEDGLASDGLDLLLAFRPWESEEHYLRYLEMMRLMRPEYFDKSVILEWLRLGSALVLSGQPLKPSQHRRWVKYVVELREERDMLREMETDAIACGVHMLVAQSLSLSMPEAAKQAARVERLIAKMKAGIDELEREVGKLEDKVEDRELDPERAARVKGIIAEVKGTIADEKRRLPQVERMLDEGKRHIAQAGSLMRDWL